MIEDRILAGNYEECSQCIDFVNGQCRQGFVPIIEIDFEGRCSNYCVDSEDEILEGAEWIE